MVDIIVKALTTLSQGPFPFLAYAVVWFVIFAEIFVIPKLMCFFDIGKTIGRNH